MRGTNVKVSMSRYQDILGPFGLGTRHNMRQSGIDQPFIHVFLCLFVPYCCYCSYIAADFSTFRICGSKLLNPHAVRS